MNSHRNCDKCNSDQISSIMSELEEKGLTWSWTPDGKTRTKNRWFGRGTKVQRREVKIVMPPEMMPHDVYRWKTIEVRP